MSFRDFLKNIMMDALKEAGSEIVKDMQAPDPVPEVKKIGPSVSEGSSIVPITSTISVVSPSVASIPSSPVSSTGRFINLGNGFYLCRNMTWTVWLNKSDWGTKSQITLGTNSPHPVVTRDMIPNLRGISLPVPINRKLVCSLINQKNGLCVSYGQIDTGPGYTNNRYWTEGTAPKTESGYDYLGNKSAHAGVDCTPKVIEDMGWASYDDAFNKELSGTCDMLIYDPPVNAVSKVTGHEIPSSDSREWINELPDTGSQFFSWKELLRGWNRNERPPQSAIDNLIHLTTHLLHPIRVKYGRIRLGSGLRDSATNANVGGRDGSLHMDGRAADLVPLDTEMKVLYQAIISEFKPLIRECVLEDYGHDNAHVHVSGPILNGENQDIHVK